MNTCPENFIWKSGQGASLWVDAPGLYEITLAFFSKKKKPIIQILANDEVIVQTIAKSDCGSCGAATKLSQTNGHVQKMASGIYKVSVVEFVALPSKSILTAVFNYAKKESQIIGAVVNAEGFMGLRKL